MDFIIALLELLSLAGLFTFSIMAVYGLIKRNGKAKKYGKYFGISFLAFIFALIYLEESTTPEVDLSNTEEVQLDEEKEREIGKVEKTKEKPEKKFEEKTNQKVTNTSQIPTELDRVVDGDTAYLIVDGVSENTRFLLIDTPETKSPNSCVQPYGEEATQRVTELLGSGEITIEYDGPRRDRYDRLLIHIFVDGVSIQETLLEEGLARIAYIYDPPYKYMDQYESAEERAKSSGKNIWSKSGYATSDGFTDCIDGLVSSSTNSNNNSTSNSQSVSNGGEKEYFENCTELKKVYPDGVAKGHPAYQSKMDRDKDNWACE